MSSTINAQKESKMKKIIIALSVVIPLAVAALFGIKIDGVDTSFLPPIYAAINGITAILLILAVVAIKNGNRKRHESFIKTSMIGSSLFLVMYVIYHMTSDSTEYGGEGFMKGIYLFILISHIILSVGVIPLVLFAYMRAYLGKFELHKKLAKWAFPLWLYVCVSGVLVYLMISPYYS